ncbi:MAG: mandelate racemase/muconate lactonizing enzyme family protein [Firmicutes bacterium]|jgi:D-galactarolactone cycloisomerase|nr:mandelate racemase/muconate lactonizing enzyme family protein [Bacillota bacterium]
MRITDVSTCVLKAPLERPFYSATMMFDHRKSLLVRVETDEGIVGWGEAGQFGPAELPKSVIEHVFGPMLIGEDPLNTEKLWQDMYCRTRDYGQKGSVIEAISGIDIALWDIKGKALNLPVSTLLGGRFRERVQAYATGLYYQPDYTPEDYVREAEAYVDKGFKGIKVKIGSNALAQDLALVAGLRREFGEDFLIMVDSNHAYNTRSAIRVGKELERYGVYWFEEPVIPEDIDGYVEVRRALNIAIAGGECEFTHYGFKNLITRHAVDIAQPDLSVTGGFTACKKVADLAHLFGVMVVPHIWGSSVAVLAGLQLIAAIPDLPPTNTPRPGFNETLLEFDQSTNPLRERLSKVPIELSDGFVAIPDRPGIGIDIDETVIEKYCVSGDRRLP